MNNFSRWSQRVASERVRVRQRKVLSDQWTRLEQVVLDYQRSDGQWQQQQREIYYRDHGAAVLLFNREKRTIILIRQFRFSAWAQGADGFLLEVPAGIIENDNPEQTVITETREETGYDIDHAEFLFKAFATPGAVTEQIHFYQAAYDPQRRSGAGGGLHAEGEDIEVVEMGIDDAVAGIADGRIVDVKTVVLVQHAQLNVFA